mgnify:FL=1
MSENISVTLKKFNDRIRAMNQTRSKDILFTADDARNLHVEVFALLLQIAHLSNKLESSQSVDNTTPIIEMDGGTF